MPRRPKPKPPPKRHERAWGAGSVAALPGGKWRAHRAREHRPDGTTLRPSRTFSGPNAEQRARIWASGAVEPAVLLLGHWLDRWLSLTLPRVTANTRRNYERYVDLCAPIAARPLADLTVEDWQLLTNALIGRYKRSTVQVWRSTISAALKAAVPRYLPANPMSGVRLPRAEERPVKAWRRDEVSRLLEAARGGAHETWLWLALGTGLRLGEARALLWTDVDWTERTITISKSLDHHTSALGQTKSRRTRVVDLPEELLPILRAHRARQRTGDVSVCTSSFSGRVPKPSAVQVWLSRLCARAGVTVLSPHAARHSYASLLLSEGVPITEVSRALGHATPAITLTIYAHYVQQRERRGANAIGALLTGLIPTPIRGVGPEIGTSRSR